MIQTIFTKEQEASIATEFKQLAIKLNETYTRINALNTHFEEFKSIADVSAGMIFDNWDFGPIHKLIADSREYYISREQHESIFHDPNIYLENVQNLQRYFNFCVQNLQESKCTGDDFCTTIQRINMMLEEHAMTYIENMETTVNAAQEYSKLNDDAKEAFDHYLYKCGKPSLGGANGSASKGLEHITRFPLMLNALSSICKEIDYPGFEEQTHTLVNNIEKIKAKVDEITSNK